MTRVSICCALLLAACKTDNPESCELAENAAKCHDGGGSGGPCASNEQCTTDPGGHVCSPGGVCVQCLANTDCGGTTPVCDVTAETCGACTANTDCASGLCLVDDGSCAAPEDIAWVSAGHGTAAGTCERDSQCTELSKAVGLGRRYVHVDATGAGGGATTIATAPMSILGEPGAAFTSDGIIAINVKITATQPVLIRNLALRGAGSAGNGIDISTSGKVTLDRVTVEKFLGVGLRTIGDELTMSRCNVVQNTGGGVVVESPSTFDITNTIVANNGNSSSLVGGLILRGNPTGSRVAFDTVADNTGMANVANSFAGLYCPHAGFHATQNLVVSNQLQPGNRESNVLLTGERCDVDDSLIVPANSADDVDFISRGGPNNNYHLGPDSRAIDASAATSDIAIDIDGEARPHGAKNDVGADERY